MVFGVSRKYEIERLLSDRAMVIGDSDAEVIWWTAAPCHHWV
jgi:hypothetical protein